VLLLVSGIIGSSIFLTAKDIAGPLPQPVLFLGVWVLGGIVSLFGCVAFAELGSMFPDSGGQYVYLREAYGDLVAFLYGWMLFSVANGGTIAALSVASAAYMGQIAPAISQQHVVFSALGITLTRAHLVGLFLIVVLTYVNVVGLRWGALLQNVSTWTKFAAMAAFVVLGIVIGKGHWANFNPQGVGITMGLSPGQFISAMGIGLIAVFWAYDGWVYITWVAGEVKEPRRNVPLAMVLGIIAVGVIYMAMNVPKSQNTRRSRTLPPQCCSRRGLPSGSRPRLLSHVLVPRRRVHCRGLEFISPWRRTAFSSSAWR
jgi:APA family basic amino acid/polyamine antiporter